MDTKIKVACKTTGGKGNTGHFIERDPKICAAGVPTSQSTVTVGAALRSYRLQDEVDALISDAIKPKPIIPPLPPLRHPIPMDMRYAGPFCEVATLINPPLKTKFQQIAEDIKETVYSSYWKQVVGTVPDQVPMLPDGMDVYKQTFGKKTPYHGRLYDIVMPPEPFPDKTPVHKGPGVQKKRCYFSPPFLPNLTYGHRTNADVRGFNARCCLTDDKRLLGTDMRAIVHNIQADFQEARQSQDGIALAPNNNINNVPEGHSFGKLKPPDTISDVLCYCKLNPHLLEYRKYLKHLNTLRINLSKRFLPNFFMEFYRNLKYIDKQQTGWLPKGVVYDFCGTKLIRFEPKLLEPLLTMWEAFDGSQIDYKTFVRMINYREPTEGLPHVQDVGRDCLDFRTTYTEMVKPGKEDDGRDIAGLPSKRLDLNYPKTPIGRCKADRVCLMDECNMRSRISPSVLQLMNLSHRDMYEKRDHCTIRKVFEGAGEVFTDDQFCSIWEEAAKQHPEGWVCYETFRKALDNFLNKSKNVPK